MSILERPIESSLVSSRSRRDRFAELYDETFADIDAYCHRRTDPSTAADAVSETFLTAWRRFDDMPLDGNAPRLWLFGVARRVLANLHRSAERRDRLHLRLVDQPRAAAPAADQSVEQSTLHEALAMLSDADAEVLRLVAWEGLSHAEAGVVLDCTANAVGVRVHRAKQRLAIALSAHEPSAHEPSAHEPSAHEPSAGQPNANAPEGDLS